MFLQTCCLGVLLFVLGIGKTKHVSHFPHIPGMEQKRDYAEGARVNVSVNSLHSHEALVSLDYYSMPFCGRTRKVEAQEQNYGQVLWGDKIESSEYDLDMMKPTNCGQIECSAGERWLSPESLALFETRINNGYRGDFVIDNLPVSAPRNGVRVLFDGKNNRHCYDTAPRGWALGVTKKCHGELTLIHNHLIFDVTVNKHQDNRYIIVGVKVIPFSVDWAKMEGGVQSCTNAFNVKERKIVPLTTTPHEEKGTPVYWTYGVKWSLTKVDWSNRWDEYLSLSLSNSSPKVHWAAIMNTFLIILCLSATVARILLRTLHMDFNRYLGACEHYVEEEEEEEEEETGWKALHGDVFRRPSYPGVFAVIVGTGFQLLGMFALCIILALFGYLSPAFRGGLITVAMLVFVLMAVLNGIVTGYVLNMFEKREWKFVFLAGLGYPTMLFAPWMCKELSLLSLPGANTAPIVAVVEMMGLWFGVSLPLIILGAGIGFRMTVLKPVTTVSKFPRRVPPQRWYLETPVLCVFPGLVPFGAAFVELRYILFSMWKGEVYYVFGFLALSSATVVVAAAQVTVVVIYFVLVFEEHRWWWRAMAVPGGMAFWFFTYGIYYYNTYLQLRTATAIAIYFQTMSLISISIFIAAATVGVTSSYIFIRAIYGQIKID